MPEPGRRKAVAAMGSDKFGNAELVGFGGCRAEGECDLAKAKFEQAIAAP